MDVDACSPASASPSPPHGRTVSQCHSAGHRVWAPSFYKWATEAREGAGPAAALRSVAKPDSQRLPDKPQPEQPPTFLGKTAVGRASLLPLNKADSVGTESETPLDT